MRASRSDSERVPGLLLAVLGALTAIAPFSMDVSTPSLPQLARDLGIGQLGSIATITACLLGMAIGQLMLGPLSDVVGRRPVLLLGVLGWTAASVVCALADDGTVLVVARFVQGLAGSAGLVVARAVVGDRTSGAALARGMAVLGSVSAIAPVVAPVVGGVVAGLGGWRAAYVTLAVIGVLLIAWVLVAVQESHPADRRTRATEIGRGLVAAAAIPTVRSATIVLGLSSVAFFAYIAGSSAVVQVAFGRSRTDFVLAFAAAAVVTLGSGLVVGRLAARLALPVLAASAASVGAAGGVAAAAALLTDWGFPAFLVGIGVYAIGWGALLPAVFSAVQSAAGERGGAASAVVGGVQLLAGAAGSLVPGLGSSTGGTVPFAWTLALGSVAAAAVAIGWSVARGVGPRNEVRNEQPSAERNAMETPPTRI